MRIEKFLADCGLGTRREIKEVIARGGLKVNGTVIRDGGRKIEPEIDIVEYKNKSVKYKRYYYYIMNKPQGYITATEDKNEKTVMELLPEWVNIKELSPVGRLDKDTEGVLLFTNNGQLAHEILSPKKHVSKVYYVRLEKEIDNSNIAKLEEGVFIEKDYKTKEAKVKQISSNEIELEIVEGKFHQVKRMAEAVGNKVVFLKRIKFAGIELGDLKTGEVKEIEENDITG